MRLAKGECLSKLILFGESSLRLALKHYVTHSTNENCVESELLPEKKILRGEGALRTRVEW